MIKLQLMPFHFRKYGWTLLILTLLVFTGSTYYGWEPPFLNHTHIEDGILTEVNLVKQLTLTLLMLALIIIAFSRHKQEDEYISYLRLSSWQYSILASLFIAIFGMWTLYGWDYVIFSVLNMFTAPIVFIIIFNISVYRSGKKSIGDEE